MKLSRYIFFALFVLFIVQSFAQGPITRVEGGRRLAVVVDSAVLRADSLQRDSIRRVRIARDSIFGDSVTYAKHVADSVRRSKRFSLTRDTISAGAHFALSLVPGMGQIYNRQWWKAPIFYATIGGFLTGGLVMSNQYRITQAKWQNAVSSGEPLDVTRSLQQKMYDQQSLSTMFYCLAGVSYLYNLADATLNYRGKTNHIRKATMLAALFPGAGFFYTRTYWRLPIYYGGFAVMASVIDYNNRYYVRFKTAYDITVDGDPKTIDEFGGRYSPDVLKNARDAYRRDRDFGIIATVAIYLLSVLDTYVTATLKNWDVSPELGFRLEPKLFEEHLGFVNSAPSGAGLSLKLTF